MRKGPLYSTVDLGLQRGEVCTREAKDETFWMHLWNTEIRGLHSAFTCDKRTSYRTYLRVSLLVLLLCLYGINLSSILFKCRKQWEERPLHLCNVFLDLPHRKDCRALGQDPSTSHSPWCPCVPPALSSFILPRTLQSSEVFFLKVHQSCKKSCLLLCWVHEVSESGWRLGEELQINCKASCDTTGC